MLTQNNMLLTIIYLLHTTCDYSIHHHHHHGCCCCSVHEQRSNDFHQAMCSFFCICACMKTNNESKVSFQSNFHTDQGPAEAAAAGTFKARSHLKTTYRKKWKRQLQCNNSQFSLSKRKCSWKELKKGKRSIYSLII